MPVGFRNAAGVDFDSLFDPDVRGDGPQATGFRTASGVTLRYAALAYGSKGPNVGFRTSAGVDLSNLWAAKGTAVYQSLVPIPNLSVFIPLGWIGPTGLRYGLRLLRTGRGERDRGPEQPALNFNWMSDGNPPTKNYQVRVRNLTVTGGGAPWQAVNTAASWSNVNASSDQVLVELYYNSTTAAGESNITATAIVEFREAGSTTILQSNTITLSGQAGQS